MSTCMFPRHFEGLGGLDDDISSLGLSFAACDRSSPIMLGMDVASSMDLIIDTTRGTAYSRLLGRYLPTMRMPTGHLTWDLRPTEEYVRARQRTRCVFERRRQCDSGPRVQGRSRLCSSQEKTDTWSRLVTEEAREGRMIMVHC